ncbi:MAG: methyl-accepting chemotaxis protein [Sulfitobacter sp.]
MSVTLETPSRVHPLRSLFFKCTLMVAICVVLVVTIIEVRNMQTMITSVEQSIAAQAEKGTGILGAQLGGAVRFGNTAEVEKIISEVTDGFSEGLIGVVVYDVAGNALYESDALSSLGAGRTVLSGLSSQATATGAAVTTPDGMAHAALVRFGNSDEVVGSVATLWNSQSAVAALEQGHFKTMIVGFGVFLVALVAAGGYLLTQMSRPLVRLEQAMQRIAEGDYDIAVPSTTRKDEVGQIAQRLDKFRETLAEADASKIDTIFKSAAFQGSSAAMMIVDERARVTYANPSCESLLGDLGDDLSDVWPGFSAQSLIGADLQGVHRLEPMLASALRWSDTSDEARCNGHIELGIGKRVFSVTVNPAVDSQGKVFGGIVEWADRTEARSNAALVNAIDKGQLRLDFWADGAVCDANENFLRMINGAVSDTARCSLKRMFANNLEQDPDGSKFAKAVLADETPAGRFAAYSVHADQTFTIEGSFSVLRNEADDAERVIFIGADVTAQQALEQNAKEERAEIAREQKRVVDLLGRSLKDLSDGKLDSAIEESFPPTYEQLRSDFNTTVESLRLAISAVMHNADSIRNETSEITTAADDLSRRTEKQAATLEETAAALDELTVSVKSAAEGADEASKMSEEAKRNAEQGGEVARQAVVAMDGIKTSSHEISKITSLIDDIAFQTNLLALNAGVEAARAGEAGRGFAVVATEVRALAQRSSDAAREINELISSSGDQVQQGVDLVDRTGTALASIVTSVAEISNRVSNIAGSSQEQSSGLAEINTAVNELDHVTQQNAAMFEETTAASHALTSEADALVTAVSRFKMEGLQITARKPAQAPPLPPVPAAQPVAASATHGSAAVDLSEELHADGWEEF